MTTVFGDSGRKNSYAYYAMSKSSSPASSIAMSRSSSSSSAPASPEDLALEGLYRVDICQPKGTAHVLEAINLQTDKLIAGASNQQYLVFRDVTQSDLAEIDSVRPKYTRVTYYKDINLLVIKLMPSAKHETAHLNFGKKILVKVIRMGMSDDDLWSVGATRCYGPSSSKEGDTSFKPASRVRETDLPTIVIEAGLSESLARLRADAKLWLSYSRVNGDKVEIVVLISIKSEDKILMIEKWQNVDRLLGRPITRANPAMIPTQIQQITIRPNATTGAITPNEVTGAPLVLHFEKIFLRQPTALETDLTFTANELADFATKFWGRAQ
jgi:hypothetical protein